MAIFSFRTRNADDFRIRSAGRDDETDARRFDRLARLLDELTEEITVEKTGLERRYRSVTTDAAFLDEAIENEDVSARSRNRAEELTSSILACERRLEALSRQASVLDKLRKTMSELAKKTG